MTIDNKHIGAAVLAVAITTAGLANAGPTSTTTLLTAQFETRKVVTIEGGSFHFVPGQDAPIHTHEAPAIGVVTKGTIIYQIEGGKPLILHTGDAFYEPAGPNIVQFDNASVTEEAIFVDFNLQQKGEPFIVFPEPLTEDIDRRAFPTVDPGEVITSSADINSTFVASGGSFDLVNNSTTVGVVAEGVVEISIDGKAVQRIAADESFSLTAGDKVAKIVNASSEVPAKVLTFVLN
jgi:quercetin dioxygenase-like cupin family protein